MRSLAPDSDLPGLRLVRRPGAPHTEVRRAGPNQWLALVGAGTPSATPISSDPGLVAPRMGPGPRLAARVELGACGAWVTMACTAGVRPLVVRRAGWVDERGDPASGGRRRWPEDRVGLGPGDAIVVVAAGDDHEGTVVDRAGPDADPDALRLLPLIGEPVHVLAAAVAAAVAIEVPASIAGRGAAWVSEATGVPESDLALPGYPLGDADPGLWRLPPAPPRRAVFHLGRDLARLRDLRGVLGRVVRSWRLEGRVDTDVLGLLTSEVAANALVHTTSDAAAVVCYLGDLVRVSVRDGSPDSPVLRAPTLDDTSGRGLALVHAQAKGWGVEARPGGKEIWFDLPVSSG